MIYQNYSKWTVSGRDWTDNWEYRNFKEYPGPDASDAEIRDFVKDAKSAELMIERDLVADGMTPEEAHKVSCQYPLKDNAPMDAVRSFVEYMYSMQESEKKGLLL